MKRFLFIISLFFIAHYAYNAEKRYIAEDGLDTQFDQTCPSIRSYLEMMKHGHVLPKYCNYLNNIVFFNGEGHIKDDSNLLTLGMIGDALHGREFYRVDTERSYEEYKKQQEKYDSCERRGGEYDYCLGKGGVLTICCYNGRSRIEGPKFQPQPRPFEELYRKDAHLIRCWKYYIEESLEAKKATVCEITPEQASFFAKLKYFISGHPDIGIVINANPLDESPCSRVQKYFQDQQNNSKE